VAGRLSRETRLPIVGKISQLCVFIPAKESVHRSESLEIRGFRELARVLQSVWHAQPAHHDLQRRMNMTQSTPFASRAAAALSAFALSLLLIGGTVATPSAAQASSAATYVGVVA
jgi:hypothetical protein